MSKILFKNIDKVYPGNVSAVTDFNLEIDDKEFIILVGPSGCGKSTTLRMVAGLEEISGGELYIGDKMVNDIAPKDRDIAMVFQNYALYPHMTVFNNMAFGLKLRKIPKDEIKERVEEAAKMLDIEYLLERKPKALSGGQRQRVALGRAMVRDPKVFLLDEPLSNLDAKLRTAMRTEITKLHKKLGTTFVYVTHDQTEAMTMGDRIVVMKDGFIQQVDTPQNLYNFPNNLFVAGFIGAPQMNFLNAKIKSSNDWVEVDFGGNFQLNLTCNKADCLRPYDSKDVVVGIRPEDLYVTGIENYNVATKAFVEITELMGSETYVYLDCFGEKLICKAPGDTVIKTGKEIDLAFDIKKMHFFEKETETTICN